MTKNTYLLFTISALIILFSCGNKAENNDPKIKTEKISRYWYRLGVADKEASETTLSQYNSFGKPTEELSSSSKKLYVYEKDTLLISETEYGLKDNSIWYKKNIKYNENDTRESLKIYTSFTNSKTPELVSGMKFYYDSNNRISAKRYFGAIEHNGVENAESISDGPNTPDILERENKRKVDSSNATYLRNTKGDILKIYFNNDTSDKIIYTYNEIGKIISKQRFYKKNKSVMFYDSNNPAPKENNFFNLKYYYKNGTLNKIEVLGGNHIREVKLYNSKEQLIEHQYYILNDELSWKWKYTYYENGKIKDITKYNDIEEPELVDRFEYEYY
jgi:hypothetical protein